MTLLKTIRISKAIIARIKYGIKHPNIKKAQLLFTNYDYEYYYPETLKAKK